MKNVSNYADLLVNVHNLLTFPSNSVELRIFNIYGNIFTHLLDVAFHTDSRRGKEEMIHLMVYESTTFLLKVFSRSYILGAVLYLMGIFFETVSVTSKLPRPVV